MDFAVKSCLSFELFLSHSPALISIRVHTHAHAYNMLPAGFLIQFPRKGFVLPVLLQLMHPLVAAAIFVLILLLVLVLLPGLDIVVPFVCVRVCVLCVCVRFAKSLKAIKEG